MGKTKRKTASSRRRKTIRIAVIGAGGRAAGAHYPCFVELPACDLVAACDVDEERLAGVCDRFGIAGRYTDFRRMIEVEKPDAVYAFMPPHHLYDVAAEVMERGCHLFIEKPPAVTTEQVRQLAAIARRQKVHTGVTFQRRFSPLIRQGKARCEARGAVHTAHASFYKNWVGGAPYYKGGMDMLTCDGIHAVDTLRYLCGGEVESVAADNRRLDAGHWNLHLALVRFSSGATGLLLNNFMAGRRIFSVEIHAPGISFFGDPEEGGQLYADNQNEPAERLDPFELAGSQESHRAFGAFDTHLHFLDCLRKGRAPETAFDDAAKTMALVDEVYGNQI
ncbi:MAG TPA: gfo/Idh/MocA family oxidoreductase [Candidatus Latescibacteria bacterium]|nr:gfo/Idh/MocA family oxidoreductase [Candidatus Latescibacterota bacterium]